MRGLTRGGPLTRPHEGCPAVDVECVLRRAVLQHPVDDVDASAVHRPVQRRAAAPVLLRVRRAIVTQLLDRVEAAGVRRQHQAERQRSLFNSRRTQTASGWEATQFN